MKRKRSVVSIILGLLVLVACGGVVAVAYQKGLFGPGEQDEVAQGDGDAAKEEPKEEAEEKPVKSRPVQQEPEEDPFGDLPINQGSQTNMRPRMQPEPEMMTEPIAPRGKPRTMPEMMEEEKEVEVPPALKQALASVRAALGKRDLAGATALLTKAKALAKTPELEEAVYPTELLVKYVEGFWKEVRQALAGLEPPAELQVGSTVFSVTEVTPTSLSIRVLGQLKSYKVIDDLPSGVAIALAQLRLPAENPQNKVYFGAFQAVDSKGSIAEARRLWGEAAVAGIETDSLMTLAELAPTGVEAELMREQGELPDAKAIAAAEAALASSMAEVKAAKLPAQRIKVAQKLLEAAITNGDFAQKFVLLREARDLAAMSDPILALQACDELGKHFKVDGLALKAAVLAKAPTRNAATAKETAEAAMTLVEEAVMARNFELAEKLSSAALNAARKSQNLELMKQVNAKRQEVLAMKKQ